MKIVMTYIILIFSTWISSQTTQPEIIVEYGIELKLIPAGEFYMGGDLDNEKPIHRVVMELKKL